MEQGIDVDLTTDFEWARASGLDYYGPMVSNAEVDHLLYGADEVNENYSTRLTEEIMKRAHGLNVDLSVQGAAAMNLVQYVKNDDRERDQSHNVYIVTAGKSRERSLHGLQEPNTALPTITPDDVNKAVGSLDFAPTRVTTTKLGGLTLAKYEDTNESAFLAQLETVQALKHFGVDVSYLVNHVSVEWQVSFVEELLATAAFAPVEDVPAWLASGGRPPPQIYVSPNVVSRLAVAQRPTSDVVDPTEQVAFWGRSQSLVKLTMLLTNTFHGPDAVRELKLCTNGNHMSKFRPHMLRGYVAESKIVPTPGRFGGRLADASCLEAFVAARQALRVATAVADRAVASEQRLCNAMASARSLLSFRERQRARGFFDPQERHREGLGTGVEQANPARMIAVTLGALHGTADHTYLEPFMVSCNTYLWLTFGLESHGELPLHYARLRAMAGVAGWLTSINIQRALQFKEIEAMCQEAGAYARVAVLYLLCRTATHMRPALDDSMMALYRLVQQGKLPTKMVRIGREARMYRVGPAIRSHKFMLDTLSIVSSTAPFSYQHRIHKGVIGSLSAAHVLGVRLTEVADACIRMDKWQSATSRARVSVQATARARAANMFAMVRDAWSAYYGRKMQQYMNMVWLCNASMDKHLGADLTNLTGIDGWIDKKKAFYSGLLVEAIFAASQALAYEYYKIEVRVGAEGEGLEQVIANYQEALRLVPLDEARSSIRVDAKLTAWQERGGSSRPVASHLYKAACRRAASVVSASTLLTITVDQVIAIMRAGYADASWAVATTMREAVTNDWNAARGSIVRTQRSTEIAPASLVPTPVNFSAIQFEDYSHLMNTLPIWAGVMQANMPVVSAMIKSQLPDFAAKLNEIAESDNFTEMRLAMRQEHAKRLSNLLRVHVLMDPAEAADALKENDRFKEALQAVHDTVCHDVVVDVMT